MSDTGISTGESLPDPSDFARQLAQRVTNLESQLASLRMQGESERQAITEALGKTQSELTAATEARVKAQSEQASATEVKARVDGELNAAIEARTKSQSELGSITEIKANAQGEFKAIGETRAKTESELATAIEARTKTQGELGLVADARAKAQGELASVTDAHTKVKEQLALATDAQNKLQAELASAGEARTNCVEQLQAATEARQKAEGELSAATNARNGVQEQLDNAARARADVDKELALARKALNLATSIKLAAAFSDKAKEAKDRELLWLVVLITSLLAAGIIGWERYQDFTDLIPRSPGNAVIGGSVLIGIFGLAAPVWLAWMATRMISKNFALTEDYAYKAALAQSYVGFRDEAKGLDPVLEQRLFAATITHLDANPVRLMDSNHPGSPLQDLLQQPFMGELMKDDSFRQHLVNWLKDRFGSRLAGYVKVEAKSPEIKAGEIRPAAGPSGQSNQAA